MRKLFIIFLSALYLVLSLGFTQYTHYCKGVKEQTSLASTHNGNKPCPVCSIKEKGLKEKKKDCCKHKSKLLKIEYPTLNNPANEIRFEISSITIPDCIFGTASDFSHKSASLLSSPYSSSTIPIRGNPLFILNSVYRI